MKINVTNWDLISVFQYMEDHQGDSLWQDGYGQSWLHFDPQSG
jgi:hypothetical protein